MWWQSAAFKGVDKDLLVAFLRVIARTDEYRSHVGKVISRYPDEAWREPGVGWVVTFRLLTEKYGQQLLYILDKPSPDGPAVIKDVSWVAMEGFEVPNPSELAV